MKPKFKVGDMVDFEELTGEIVEVIEYDDLEDFDLSPCYKIKVKTPAMKGGFCFFGREEEVLTLSSRRAKQ